MASIDLSAESLDRLEAQLTADLEAVRRIRALLSGRQPASVPVASIAALLPAAAPAAAPPAASGAQSVPPTPAAPSEPYSPPHYPQMDVRDVNVAVREVVATLDGAFGMADVKKQVRIQHYRKFGDGSIRTVLQKMLAQGELSFSSQCLGRAGYKYVRSGSA